MEENEGGIETEKERDGEKQGIWRGAMWREELQHDERLREGRGAKSLSIPPYFALNLNCSVSCTNVTAGANEIISPYLHLNTLWVMLNN